MLAVRKNKCKIKCRKIKMRVKLYRILSLQFPASGFSAEQGGNF